MFSSVTTALVMSFIEMQSCAATVTHLIRRNGGLAVGGLCFSLSLHLMLDYCACHHGCAVLCVPFVIFTLQLCTSRFLLQAGFQQCEGSEQ